MCKQANEPAPINTAKQVPQMITVPGAPDAGAGARSRAIQLALASLLGGAAVGGTVTGLSGLSKLLSKPQPPSIPQELEMDMPVPEKQANDPVELLGGGWWKGHHATSPADLWWTIPAVAGGATAGTLGMSALMEHVLKKKRKAMMDQELSGAQQNFQQSLLNQYKKEGSADSLDQLFDRVEKKAGVFADGALSGEPRDYLPLGIGAGVTAGGLLAYLAARGAYKTQEGRTNEDLLSKALKNRSYLRSLQSPPPVVFNPQPVKEEQQ